MTREEGVVVDLAAEAEELGAVAEPDASWLTGLEVVVRQLLDVVGAGVGALQGGHAHGHRDTPRGASVHSSIHEVPWVRVGWNCGGMATYTENRRGGSSPRRWATSGGSCLARLGGRYLGRDGRRERPRDRSAELLLDAIARDAELLAEPLDRDADRAVGRLVLADLAVAAVRRGAAPPRPPRR